MLCSHPCNREHPDKPVCPLAPTEELAKTVFPKGCTECEWAVISWKEVPDIEVVLIAEDQRQSIKDTIFEYAREIVEELSLASRRNLALKLPAGTYDWKNEAVADLSGNSAFAVQYLRHRLYRRLRFEVWEED